MEPRILVSSDRFALAQGILSVDDWVDANVYLADLDEQDMMWLRDIDGIQSYTGQHLVDRFNHEISIQKVSSGAKTLLAVRRIQEHGKTIVFNSDSCGEKAFKMLCDYIYLQLCRGNTQHAIPFAAAYRSDDALNFVFEGWRTGYVGKFNRAVGKEMAHYEYLKNGKR